MKLPLLYLAIFLTGGPAIPFTLAVLFHECGHLLAGVALGCPLRTLKPGSMGLEMSFATHGLSYGRELILLLSGSVLGLVSIAFIPSPMYRMCALCLNLANLLPLRGLDGWGILTCLTHGAMEGDTADRLCSRVSMVTAVAVWLCGMWIVLRVGPNLTWMLCGLGALAGEVRK